MGKTTAHCAAQNKLIPLCGIQTIFCADASFALFYIHIFLRSLIFICYRYISSDTFSGFSYLTFLHFSRFIGRLHNVIHEK
jgi:hypothetical protein